MDSLQTLAALIAAIGVISGVIISTMKHWLTDEMNEVKSSIGRLSDDVKTMDYNDSKRYLTEFISDIDLNIPKNDIQKKMAHEVYDHYTTPKDQGGLGGNSFVEDGWERLKREGKI